MIAQTLALAAAGGGKAFGWDCPEPCKVLYVDGEQSERAIKGRFSLLPTAIPSFDAEKAANNLVLMIRSAQDNPLGFLDVADTTQHTAFLRAVKNENVRLIIFDNLSTLSDKIDDNKSAAFKPVQSLLTHLKKLNAAVILVHHAGKDPNRGYRGSSSIATTFERILAVRKNEAAPASRIDVTVALEKFRDEIPEGFRPVFPLKFKTTTEKDGSKHAQWEVGDLGQLEEAWGMFSGGEYRTKAAFVAAFNDRFSTAHKASNFGRDFAAKWETKLGKTEKEIKAAERRMNFLRECDGEKEDFSGSDQGESGRAGKRDF